MDTKKRQQFSGNKKAFKKMGHLHVSTFHITTIYVNLTQKFQHNNKKKWSINNFK